MGHVRSNRNQDLHDYAVMSQTAEKHGTVRNIVNNVDGASKSTVQRRLTENGITLNNNGNAARTIRNMLEDQTYMFNEIVRKGQSATEVARSLGVTTGRVNIAMDQHGIQSEFVRARQRKHALVDATNVDTRKMIVKTSSKVYKDKVSGRYFIVAQDERYKAGITRRYLAETLNTRDELVLSTQPIRVYSTQKPYSQTTIGF